MSQYKVLSFAGRKVLGSIYASVAGAIVLFLTIAISCFCCGKTHRRLSMENEIEEALLIARASDWETMDSPIARPSITPTMAAPVTSAHRSYTLPEKDTIAQNSPDDFQPVVMLRSIA